MEKMDNSVDSILGMMEGILETAKVFPMSHGRVLVDQEQFLDMLAGKDGFLLSMLNGGGMNFWGVFFFFL